MRYLCIDTSAGSRVALVEGNKITRASSQSPRAHAEHLAGLIREVLGVAPGDAAAGHFDAVVVGTGPAPYTGLRAGLISARVLARGANVPAYGVSALDIAARCALDEVEGPVLALLDARRKELYAAEYDAAGDNDVRRRGEILVDLPANLAQTYPVDSRPPLVGPGAYLYESILGSACSPNPEFDVAVAARIAVTRFAQGGQNLELDPLYLRRPDVSVPNPRKSTLG
ncbi:tRNA (adenosine(37)-N6)-threonylcarbamoyltransferase complex dimerization subunit type 1 TsaB [Actinomycetaceae bacterium TAE3-ERU4]|nr:tRNA (adenosine(37)-N6)-threonylcarbamoyltransferase complex dimerization subunit type 1 TsaB [Actinomycetaceae bacterium TAE3-ERU4]